MTISCDHPRPKLNLPGYTPPRYSWQPPTFLPSGSLADLSRALTDQFRGVYAVLQQLGQRRTVVPLIEDLEARAGQVIVGVANGQTIRLPLGLDGELGQVGIVLTDVISPVTIVNPDGSTQTLGTAGAYDFVNGLTDSYQTNPGGTVLGGGIATDRLLGRDSAGTGAFESISVTGGLEFSGSQSIRIADLGVSTAKIAASAVTNAKLANMAAGRVKGVQVDGSTGDPQDLTGAEVTELLRRATVQTITSSGDITVTLNDDTTVLLFSTTASVRVQNIISNNASGREVAIEHVRTSGTGLVTLQHQSGVGGGGVDFLLPNNGDITLGHRDGAIIRYRPSFWRLQSRSGTFSSRFPGQPIYDVMAPPFNAAGNGATDDTAAINAAIAAANADPGPVYLGEAHLVTASLTAITGDNVFIVGRGEFGSGSRLIASGATPFDIITIDTANTSGVRNVQIEGPGTWASEGWAIRIVDGFKTRVVGCRITGTYGAIEILHSVITEIIQVYLAAIDGPVGFYAHGTAADGENHALTFNACACGTDSTGGTIAWYKQGSYAHTFELINCGALEGGYGLLVEDDDPGANSEPLFTRTVNFQADHIEISGIRLAGGAAGRFTHTFITSTTSGPGIDIASTYSGNWEFNGGEISGINGHGISVGVGDGVITGMQIGAIASGSDCINVAASVTDFNIIGNSCGDMYASNSVARYGINIGASCDSYVVVGNRCLGNTTGSINNTPGTSTTRVVANNIPETTGSAGAVQTVSGLSGDITVTVADDTGVLLIESTANIRLQALISDNLANRQLIIEHVRTSGTGVLTLQHQSGVGGGGVDMLLPNAADVVLGNRAGAVIRMRPNFWRMQAVATGVFNATQQGLVPVSGATATNVLRADATWGTVATAGIADDAVTDTKLRNSAALSVIGRAANSTGDPADIAAAANDRLLARTSDSLAFQQLTNGMVPTNTVGLDKLANVAVGTVLGRQVDAGSTGAVVALTGAEQAENFRRATVQTVTGLTGDITVTLNDDTTVLLIESTANIRLQAISHSNQSGREVAIEHVRTSGTGNLTVQHQSGVGGGAIDFLLPNNADVVVGNRAGLLIRYRPSFWRLQSRADTPALDGDKGDITVSGSGLTWTIDNDVVSDTKLRNSAALSVIGRATSTSGDPADIVANAVSDVDCPLRLNAAGTQVLFSPLNTPGLNDDIVTNAKLANMVQSTVKGRAAAAGTGDPTDLTGGQVRTILSESPLATASTGGTVVSNSTTKTAIISLTFSANTLAAGQMWEMVTVGWFVRAGSATATNLTISAELNGTAQTSFTAVTSTINPTTCGFVFRQYFTVDSTGGSGTCSFAGDYGHNIPLSTNPNSGFETSALSVAIDTTASNTIRFAAQFSAAAAGTSVANRRSFIRRVL